MASIKERAFDAIMEISSTFAGLRDYSEYGLVLEKVIKKLVPIDWLAIGGFSQGDDSYTIMTNSCISTDWADRYSEIYHLDKIRQNTLALDVGGIYLYDRDSCRDESMHYICDLVKKHTDTSQYLTIHTAQSELFDTILGLYRCDKSFKFTEEEKEIIQCLTSVIISTSHTMNFYSQYDFQRVVLDELRKNSNEMTILLDKNLTIVDYPKETELFFIKNSAVSPEDHIPTFVVDWLQKTIAPTGVLIPNSGPWILTKHLPLIEISCKAYTVYSELGDLYLLIKLIPHGGAVDFSVLRRQGLTPREVETLSYLPLGYTNVQIATAMQIQEVTVRKHLKNAAIKLNVQGRTELLYQALTLKDIQTSFI